MVFHPQLSCVGSLARPSGSCHTQDGMSLKGEEHPVREFFRGWKRKLGVVTLVLACLVMAAWLRSLRTRDTFQRRVSNNSLTFVISNRSWLYWQSVRESFPLQLESPESQPGGMNLRPFVITTFHFEQLADDTSYFGVLNTERFGLLINGRRVFPGLTLSVWAVPYWSIVAPISLFSAWLLLSAPRIPQPKSASET